MYENRAPREEFDVTCAECGKATTVPFKPSGTRPVLCRECFSKNRPAGGSGPRSFGDRPPRRDNFGGGAGGERQMFDTTCTRCGSATQVPFKPTPGRDVFCRDCFRSANPR
jgi:CxxC-x17-CxxC domain-containing protein